MRLSRRRTMLALGTLAAGAGIMSGTGAVDSEGTDRGVAVRFAGDSEAYLGMSPGVGEDREHVSVTEEDGVITIGVDRLNRNARTVIEDLVAFTNAGERPIRELGVTLDDASTNADLRLHDALEGVSLAPGETVVGLGLTVDTRGLEGSPTITGTITIKARFESEGA